MSISMRQPHTTPAWLLFSKRLTAYVNNHHLGPERNLICYCFDHTEDNWERMPAAWHRPATADIVINLGVVFREMQSLIADEGASYQLEKVNSEVNNSDFYVPNAKSLESIISLATNELSVGSENWVKLSSRMPLTDVYKTLANSLNDGLYKAKYGSFETKVARTLLNSVLGIIVHETGHSVYTQYILEPWWRSISSYHRQILTMFEELRCEKHQTDRIGVPAINNVRYASDVVINPTQIRDDLKKSKDEDGDLDISTIALNATLILGRSTYGVFTEDEIAEYASLIESIVGENRYTQMLDIWAEFLKLSKVTETAAVALAERWEELFPQPDFKSSIAIVIEYSEGGMHELVDEGSEVDNNTEEELAEIDSVYYDNDDNEALDIQTEDKVNLPGLFDSLDDAVETMIDSAKKDPKKKPAPGTRKHPSESWRLAIKNPKLTLAEPVEADFAISNRLTRALQNIYLTGRDKFEVKSSVPPGRLRSRAAVQNAANRQRGLPQRVDQWKKSKFTVQENPKLSVGIMTDCSGSQGWAEQFSSRMNWILSRSFRSVHARTASVAFGTSVYITSKPNESTHKRRVVKANQGGEKFDVGFGTIEQMLHLTSSVNGARMLFVISDAGFVLQGETARMKAWIDDLEKANCLVVWISPQAYNLPKNKNVIQMIVNSAKVQYNPEPVIDKLIQVITTQLIAEKDRMIRH
ncbi:hypothetical protein SEA_SIXAMA_115 [Gordonia phage Sixama]|uniref:Uncharacterized protein n=1 Tax=Gordonia phage Sixama TaxID=2653271 RepID=A0A5Q2F5D2_9CAUD|nr:hypothetical protein PP302_gp115 [Gordonia phage Sixama]QGF20294.1 hypothetical protein SEA_SIXAMA_115 [Gordonia phage Sixama]